MAVGPGGRVIKELLGTDGVSLDGITSTTDTTVSTESIRVPEGFQAIFVMDVDAYATTTATFSVKYTHDGGSNWHQFYWDEGSQTAATVAISDTTTDLGAHQISIINPFTTNPNTSIGETLFRVDVETDGVNTDLTLGDCYVTVGPPIKGAVFETLL
jgi:hypothetical protein